MPALITHDQFGQEMYSCLHERIGGSRDEMEAFLLGNQGPDPLFYSVISPLLKPVHHLGGTMHHKHPNELLAAFKQALSTLSDDDRAVGRAYALGFLCHYALDSNMHPLVYFYEHALCDAGEPDLTRADNHEVHAVIESELDEMVLYARRGTTIASFNPAREILRGSPRMLNIVSKMYVYVVLTVYGLAIPPQSFGLSVLQFRAVQQLFYSPSGIKRALIGGAEELVRRYSFYRSMSHRAVASNTCPYDNRKHAAWQNPFTGEESVASFWDIFAQAQTHAKAAIATFDAPEFDAALARSITRDLDFSGEPTAAEIIAVE